MHDPARTREAERTLVLVRHGATEWSKNGRHTGTTDLPLLPEGEKKAAELADVLALMAPARVLCSPRRRARDTCVLAGFGERMEIVDDLAEWDYGDYEGLTSEQIWERWPGWQVWRDGCPGGETAAQVAARADRVIELAVSAGGGEGPVALFAHGHILRVLTVRWLAFDMSAVARLPLSPATISVLGHERGVRALSAWNADSVQLS